MGCGLTRNLETEAGKVGLRISAEKTKTLQIGGNHVECVQTTKGEPPRY